MGEERDELRGGLMNGRAFPLFGGRSIISLPRYLGIGSYCTVQGSTVLVHVVRHTPLLATISPTAQDLP